MDKTEFVWFLLKFNASGTKNIKNSTDILKKTQSALKFHAVGHPGYHQSKTLKSLEFSSEATTLYDFVPPVITFWCFLRYLLVKPVNTECP